MTGIARRTLLAMAAAAGAIFSSPVMARRIRPRLTPVERQLLSILSHQEATVLGARYLAEYPDEADRNYLRNALFGHFDPPTQTVLCRLLARLRERDFAAEDVVELDGWVMGRTELRACALLALCVA